MSRTSIEDLKSVFARGTRIGPGGWLVAESWTVDDAEKASDLLAQIMGDFVHEGLITPSYSSRHPGLPPLQAVTMAPEGCPKAERIEQIRRSYLHAVRHLAHALICLDPGYTIDDEKMSDEHMRAAYVQMESLIFYRDHRWSEKKMDWKKIV